MSTAPPLTDSKRFLRDFERINLALVLAAAAVASVAMGPGAFLWGVLVGGAFTIGNLRALSFLAERLIAGGSPKRRGFYVALFLVKFTALCGAIWATLALLPVAPLGVLTGFSTLLPAMLLATLASALTPAGDGGAGSMDALGTSNPRSTR